MSPPIRRADARAGRAGFSLMEILVVLTIFALATAVVMPGMSRMLDQATSHAVFFEFQRQVSDMRREANRTGAALRLVDPSVTPDPEAGERVAELRDPWRYTLAPALEIEAGGICSTASANLVNGERVVMTLTAEPQTCRFIQVLPGPAQAQRDRPTAAAPPPAPSSP